MNRLLVNMLSCVYRAPTDGEGSENGGAVGTRNNDRLAMLERISSQNDSNRKEDLQDINDDGSLSEFEAPPVEASSDQEENDRLAAELAASQAADGAATEVVEDAPAKIFRKVNGQEIEITDDLLVKAQKIAAADLYLADAKKERDEIAAQRAAKPVAPEPQQVKTDLASIARAIQMGTEEEAIEALQKLIPTGPSADDLAKTVDDRLVFKQALNKFHTEYADIVGDPVLHGMAQDMDNRYLAAGDKRPYEERYADIGDTLRGWLKSKVGEPVPAAAAQVTRLERKAAAPAPVKPASGKSAVGAEEEPEETVSDVIAEMAKARGGPQWMVGSKTRY